MSAARSPSERLHDALHAYARVVGHGGAKLGYFFSTSSLRTPAMRESALQQRVAIIGCCSHISSKRVSGGHTTFGRHSCSQKWKIEPQDAFLETWEPAVAC